MNWLNALEINVRKIFLPTKQPYLQHMIRYKSFKKIDKKLDAKSRSSSRCLQYPDDSKECFDIESVTIQRAIPCHVPMIRSFLHTHYWPREASVVGLWMDLRCSYLKILTERYSHSGDRLLAFERLKRTNENELVGVCVANKVYPWMIKELEDWAHSTPSKPEKHRMYFIAHCLKSPNLFKKYNIQYIYNIEVLGTAQAVTGQGVGILLLKAAIADAQLLRHALVQVVCTSQYTSKICERCGMKSDWVMDYSEFVDNAGQRVFFTRRPHQRVTIYTKYFNPSLGLEVPCKPPY